MIARIAMAVVALTWVGTAHATLITLEPDDFAIGTDLRTVLPEVILSVVDQPLEPVLAGDATASGGCGSTPAPEPCTSTGVLVFSRDEHSNPDHWQHGLAELRADFTVAVDFVAIDLVGIDDGGAELQAFASDDSLLDSRLRRFRSAISAGRVDGPPETRKSLSEPLLELKPKADALVSAYRV